MPSGLAMRILVGSVSDSGLGGWQNTDNAGKILERHSVQLRVQGKTFWFFQ
jgi:hypothetical protein